MVAVLQDRLRQVEVLEPTCAGRLQLFGLRWPEVSPLAYVTLDEALQTGAFVVTEVSESGSVPTLLVKNDLDARVFLLAGEQLVGAKQNRVLNVSLLVEAHGQLRVPVSCVEVGRWGYRSRQFSSSGWASHGKLRCQMSHFALEGYRAHKQPTSDQGAVWREVSRKLDTLGSHSPSAALDQAYEDHRSRLNEMLAAARVPAGCHGVAFAVGGQLAGVDLFDQPATLQKLLPKLVRAYALDALEVDTDPDVDRTTVTTWLQQAPQARFERYDSPGLGNDVRLESEVVVGAGLVLDQTPVHVELFPNDGCGPC